MSDTHEEKRIAGRRKKTRRMYDLLHDSLTDEERQQYDRLLWSRHQNMDRRTQERRSVRERRTV